MADCCFSRKANLDETPGVAGSISLAVADGISPFSLVEREEVQPAEN
jgi:hypothetical protein